MKVSVRCFAGTLTVAFAALVAISRLWEQDGYNGWKFTLPNSIPSSPVFWPNPHTDALEFIQGKSSILEASAAGDIQLVQAHITAGSDVNHRGSDGQTPLHEACWSSHPHIVRLLLNSGADVRALEAKDGDSALHWAVFKGQEQIVRMLLDAGAEVNTASAVHGHSPLDVALQLQQDDQKRRIVQLLISKGAQRANEDYREGGNQEIIGEL